MTNAVEVQRNLTFTAGIIEPHGNPVTSLRNASELLPQYMDFGHKVAPPGGLYVYLKCVVGFAVEARARMLF